MVLVCLEQAQNITTIIWILPPGQFHSEQFPLHTIPPSPRRYPPWLLQPWTIPTWSIPNHSKHISNSFPHHKIVPADGNCPGRNCPTGNFLRDVVYRILSREKFSRNQQPPMLRENGDRWKTIEMPRPLQKSHGTISTCQVSLYRHIAYK